MAHIVEDHVAIFVFTGTHSVGEGLQSMFHAHRPQGLAPAKSDPLHAVQNSKGQDPSVASSAPSKRILR